MAFNNHSDNKFKDKNGRWITQSLFVELANRPESAIYTIGEEDKSLNGKLYPSLKRLYLETMDFTEYQFARKHLGGWLHWQRLNNNAVISREIEQWREELELKLTAMGLMQIVDIALDTENKGRLSAAKILADKGFKPKQSVGRPTKKQLEAESGFHDQLAEYVSDDLERIRSLQ